MVETKKTITKKKPSSSNIKDIKPKAGNVSLSVFSLKGEPKSQMSVTNTNKRKVHPQTVNQAIRVYLANEHQGTVSSKTRSEVIGSTRKIFRQKGTGKARHGSIKAPIFVGGGVAFGPKPRQVKRSIPRKMKASATASLLWEKIASDKLKLVEGLANATGKTSEMAFLVNKIAANNTKVLAILATDMKKAKMGLRNLENVTVLTVSSVSLGHLLQSDTVLVAKEALKTLTGSLVSYE